MPIENAVVIVHWPGKDTPACELHAQKLESLGRVLGVTVSSSLYLGEPIPCTNCANEDAKVKRTA